MHRMSQERKLEKLLKADRSSIPVKNLISMKSSHTPKGKWFLDVLTFEETRVNLIYNYQAYLYYEVPGHLYILQSPSVRLSSASWA